MTPIDLTKLRQIGNTLAVYEEWKEYLGKMGMKMTNIDHADLLTAQGLFDNHSDEILYQKWLDEISSRDEVEEKDNFYETKD